MFIKRTKDFLGKTFPRLKGYEKEDEFRNAMSPAYRIDIGNSDDWSMINIKFNSKSLPDEDNAMFTGDQLEMIRDHIILLGEDLFGKLDPDSSFDLLESDNLKNGTFQMVGECVQPFAIGDWYCFNDVKHGSFDLGPHIKKRVIDAGLARRKVLIPHSTVVQYHSLGDMQGMPKIKLKNLPNEWEHTGVQIPTKDAYMGISMDAKHGIVRETGSSAMVQISDEGKGISDWRKRGIPQVGLWKQ